ncbi:hypothetical protein [Chitiniphilus shinanonensis]|uniref:hypothetical protein n=1 Tax=Chitiniphilus shinanonensis TaxID=553088 RepID=UPI0030603EEC
MRPSTQLALALGWLLSSSAFADQLVQSIGYDSGATGSDSYVGPVAALKEATSSTTITVAFESKRGTGTANIWNNRVVSWTPKYSLDGVTFTRGATRTIPVNALNTTTDAMALNFPSKSKWIIQIEYMAADTAGTFASAGPVTTIDKKTILYQLSPGTASGSAANGGSNTVYAPLPTFSPVEGTITKVSYSFTLDYLLRISYGVDDYGVYSSLITPAIESACNASLVQGVKPKTEFTGSSIACTFESDLYDPYAIYARIYTNANTGSGSYGTATLTNAKAVVTVATPVGTPTAAVNRFKLLSATYDKPVKPNALPAIVDFILD